MKMFRCPFWQTTLVLPIFIAMVVSLAIIVPSFVERGFSCLKIIKGMFAVYSFFVCVLLLSGFYIISFEDTLVVKNAICPFWQRKVCFKEVVKIKIIYPGGNAIPYLQIFAGETKWAWRYYLDHVGRKGLLELVTFLREKGVEVEAKVWRGLDDEDYLR